jgi:hypothetical protein
MKFTSKVKATNTLPNLLRKIKVFDEVDAGAGFDDKIHSPSGLPMAMLAAIHEFGTDDANNKGIPARDFMFQAFDKSMFTEEQFSKAVVNVIYGGSTVRKEMKVLAESLAKEIRESILNGDFVPLKPITIDLKGDSIPLRDTDKLLSSVKTFVDSKREE